MAIRKFEYDHALWFKGDLGKTKRDFDGTSLELSIFAVHCIFLNGPSLFSVCLLIVYVCKQLKFSPYLHCYSTHSSFICGNCPTKSYMPAFSSIYFDIQYMHYDLFYKTKKYIYTLSSNGKQSQWNLNKYIIMKKNEISNTGTYFNISDISEWCKYTYVKLRYKNGNVSSIYTDLLSLYIWA